MIADGGAVDEEGFDIALVQFGPTGAFADENPLGEGRGLGDQGRIDEAVINEDIGWADAGKAADRNQFRVARSGADNRNFAALITRDAPLDQCVVVDQTGRQPFLDAGEAVADRRGSGTPAPRR